MGRGRKKGEGGGVSSFSPHPPTSAAEPKPVGAVSSSYPAAAAHSAHKPGQGPGRLRLLRLLRSGSCKVVLLVATTMPGAAGVLLVLLLGGGLGGGRAQQLQQQPQTHQQRGTVEARALDYILLRGGRLLTGPFFLQLLTRDHFLVLRLGSALWG